MSEQTYVVTISKLRENLLNFNMVANGISTTDANVNFIIESEKMSLVFEAKKANNTGKKWEVEIPALPMLKKTIYPFKITLASEGYYFEPFLGNINVIGTGSVQVTSMPKNVEPIVIKTKTSKTPDPFVLEPKKEIEPSKGAITSDIEIDVEKEKKDKIEKATITVKDNEPTSKDVEKLIKKISKDIKKKKVVPKVKKEEPKAKEETKIEVKPKAKEEPKVKEEPKSKEETKVKEEKEESSLIQSVFGKDPIKKIKQITKKPIIRENRESKKKKIVRKEEPLGNIDNLVDIMLDNVNPSDRKRKKLTEKDILTKKIIREDKEKQEPLLSKLPPTVKKKGVVTI